MVGMFMSNKNCTDVRNIDTNAIKSRKCLLTADTCVD